MIDKGFAGKILYVDLAKKKTWALPLHRKIAEDYLGGLGICVKLTSDLLPKGVDPLSSENVFTLGTGPLVGTDLPSSSRVYTVTKLPASKTAGWCGAGGYRFGAQLKYAGYDHIVVSGSAEDPLYLHIQDDLVTLRDARHLWGLGVAETCDRLNSNTDSPAGVLAIGPAGENKSVLSMAFVDNISTLGRGGFGAVMGAKRLKAISVTGTKEVRVADFKRFQKLCQSLLESIRTYPYLAEWQDLGMIKAFPMVPGELYKRLKLRRTACVSCPVGCKDVVRIPDGPFAGRIISTSSAINLFSPTMFGMKDPWEAAMLIAALDDYGLDMFEFLGLMGLAQKLISANVLHLEHKEPEIDLTSYLSMSQWANKLAFREGTGDLLADGFPAVLNRFGPEAELPQPSLIKGMLPYAGPGAALPWDRFGTMELGQLVDPRGPHVGSGGSPTYFALRPLEVFPRHLKRMGVPEAAIDRILGTGRDELHIGRLLRHSHTWFAILASLGICARGQINRFYDADFCAQIYEAATGIHTSSAELTRGADLIWHTLHELNEREGLAVTKQVPPAQWFGESGFKDYLTGEPLTPGQVKEMIWEYFDEGEKTQM